LPIIHLKNKDMILAMLIILVVLVFIIIGLYNRLVKLRNNRENAFADIDVQLKQRLDLIPQLVEAVKGYMKHESTVLADVTNARTNALKATNINEKIAAENQLSSALQGLQVAVEAYPDLKASQNFIQLQEEIADIENKLAAARRFFNSATKELNNAVQTFPSNILAGMFGFQREPMFDLGPDKRATAEEAPKLNF
jgi:LemA protein